METNMWLQFPSSIEHVVERNESFDSCIIRICYPGKNRNQTLIPKDAIEAALPSIYNCPIVCNYSVEDDTIGGHDVEIVNTTEGLRLINLTDAIGVIPESAQHFWEKVDDNGEEREYLCVEAILWKRSPAYRKIKRDGIVSQSMEITVKNGQTIDGFYVIDSFFFTAFCLLGEDIEPCFESASLEMFSLHNYKSQFAKLMDEYKKEFTISQDKVVASTEVDIHTQNISKGGETPLDRMELLSEYGLTLAELDFNIEDFSIEELRVKFEDIKNVANSSSNEPVEQEPAVDVEQSFSLTAEQFLSELLDALYAVTYIDPYWGEVTRYMYVDHDFEQQEVYCFDSEDWKLYGFKYSINGDTVNVDFETKVRKKIMFVDFENGSEEFTYKHTFDKYGSRIESVKNSEIATIQSEAENKYAVAAQRIDELTAEIGALNEYKTQKIASERKADEDSIFSRFVELSGVDAFESLRLNCAEMTIEEIENKCFEIKGRHMTAAFAMEGKPAVRLAVEQNGAKTDADEPYGGAFIKYRSINK